MRENLVGYFQLEQLCHLTYVMIDSSSVDIVADTLPQSLTITEDYNNIYYSDNDLEQTKQELIDAGFEEKDLGFVASSMFHCERTEHNKPIRK